MPPPQDNRAPSLDDLIGQAEASVSPLDDLIAGAEQAEQQEATKYIDVVESPRAEPGADPAELLTLQQRREPPEYDISTQLKADAPWYIKGAKHALAPVEPILTALDAPRVGVGKMLGAKGPEYGRLGEEAGLPPNIPGKWGLWDIPRTAIEWGADPLMWLGGFGTKTAVGQLASRINKLEDAARSAGRMRDTARAAGITEKLGSLRGQYAKTTGRMPTPGTPLKVERAALTVDPFLMPERLKSKMGLPKTIVPLGERIPRAAAKAKTAVEEGTREGFSGAVRRIFTNVDEAKYPALAADTELMRFMEFADTSRIGKEQDKIKGKLDEIVNSRLDAMEAAGELPPKPAGGFDVRKTPQALKHWRQRVAAEQKVRAEVNDAVSDAVELIDNPEMLEAHKAQRIEEIRNNIGIPDEMTPEQAIAQVTGQVDPLIAERSARLGQVPQEELKLAGTLKRLQEWRRKRNAAEGVPEPELMAEAGSPKQIMGYMRRLMHPKSREVYGKKKNLYDQMISSKLAQVSQQYQRRRSPGMRGQLRSEIEEWWKTVRPKGHEAPLFVGDPSQWFAHRQEESARALRGAKLTQAQAAAHAAPPGTYVDEVPLAQYLSDTNLRGIKIGDQWVRWGKDAGADDIAKALDDAGASMAGGTDEFFSRAIFDLGDEGGKISMARMPADLADAINGVKRTFSSPEELDKFTKLYDDFTGIFRGAAIAPWPGYHARNEMTNLFHLYLAGVRDPRVLKDALQIQLAKAATGDKGFAQVLQRTGAKPLTREQEKLWQLAHDHGIFSRTFFGEQQALAGGGDKLSGKWLAKVLGDDHPAARYFKREGAFGPAFNVGQTLEHNSRFGLFIDGLNKGMTPGEAAKRVTKFLYEYDPRLQTEVERKGLRRAMFFYTWTRRNLPFWMERLVTHPRQNLVGGRLLGLTPFTGSREGLPEFARERATPIISNPLTGERESVDPGLSFQDLNQFSPREATSAGSLASGVVGKLMSQMAPIPKGLIELGAAASPFTGQRLQEMTRAPASLENAPGILKRLTGYRTEINPMTGEKQGVMNPYANWAIQSGLPAGGRIMSSMRQLGQGEGSRLLSGIRRETMTPEKESLQAQFNDLDRAMNFYRDRGVIRGSEAAGLHVPKSALTSDPEAAFRARMVLKTWTDLKRQLSMMRSAERQTKGANSKNQ